MRHNGRAARLECATVHSTIPLAGLTADRADRLTAGLTDWVSEPGGHWANGIGVWPPAEQQQLLLAHWFADRRRWLLRRIGTVSAKPDSLQSRARYTRCRAGVDTTTTGCTGYWALRELD